MLMKQSGHYPNQGPNIASGLANLSMVQHGSERGQSAHRAEGIIDSLAAMLWKRSKLIATCAALAVPLWTIYLCCSTPLFTAQASLLLQPKAVRFLNDGTQQLAAPDNNDYLFTQQRVITSTPVLAAALASGDVRTLDTLRGRGNALSILRKGIDVEVGKKDQLITISFDTAKPSDGVAIVGAVVDAYCKFNASLRRNSGTEILSVLKDEKAQRDSEYLTQSKDLLAFSEANGLSGDTTHGDVDNQRLHALGDALTAARLERVNAESAYDEVAAALAADPAQAKKVEAFLKTSGSVLPTIGDDTIIREQVLAYKAQQVGLEQAYGSKHPAVLAIQKKIDELGIAYAAGTKHRLNAATVREKDLQKSFDEQQKIGFEREAKQDEYNRRRSELDRSAKLVDMLDNRMKEVALTEDGGIPSVQTIDPPRASDVPTKPEKTKSLAIALIAGLLIGSMLAIAKEWGHLRVSTQSVSIALGVPVLGELPQLTAHSTTAAHGQKLLIDSGSQVTQACRMLHEALQRSETAGRGATVLVTSPSRGDGKTTLAVNMALALATNDKRVLLVDADFRSPMIGRMFNVTTATGLGTLLESADPLPVTAIHHTGNPKLDLLLSGPTRRGPSELLNGQAFIDLLGDLAHRYDYVLLDSPPVVTFTDARTIAASCDATLLVIRGQAVNRPLFNQARQGLINVGANLAGVVINADGEQTEQWNNARPPRGKGLMRTVRSLASAVDLL